MGCVLGIILYLIQWDNPVCSMIFLSSGYKSAGGVVMARKRSSAARRRCLERNRKSSIIRVIHKFHKKRGYTPPVTQIAKTTRCSPATAWKRVKGLQEDGMLEKALSRRGKPRFEYHITEEAAAKYATTSSEATYREAHEAWKRELALKSEKRVAELNWMAENRVAPLWVIPPDLRRVPGPIPGPDDEGSAE